MRPKDLMIGDWVILRDPDTNKKTKVTVTWCDLGGIILQWFEPIPITTEILEKVEFACTYVHELQHALKLVGITKEIEP